MLNISLVLGAHTSFYLHKITLINYPLSTTRRVNYAINSQCCVTIQTALSSTFVSL